MPLDLKERRKRITFSRFPINNPFHFTEGIFSLKSKSARLEYRITENSILQLTLFYLLCVTRNGTIVSVMVDRYSLERSSFLHYFFILCEFFRMRGDSIFTRGSSENTATRNHKSCFAQD